LFSSLTAQIAKYKRQSAVNSVNNFGVINSIRVLNCRDFKWGKFSRPFLARARFYDVELFTRTNSRMKSLVFRFNAAPEMTVWNVEKRSGQLAKLEKGAACVPLESL
jgi:hypothetical protein